MAQFEKKQFQFISLGPLLAKQSFGLIELVLSIIARTICLAFIQNFSYVRVLKMGCMVNAHAQDMESISKILVQEKCRVLCLLISVSFSFKGHSQNTFNAVSIVFYTPLPALLSKS